MKLLRIGAHTKSNDRVTQNFLLAHGYNVVDILSADRRDILGFSGYYVAPVPITPEADYFASGTCWTPSAGKRRGWRIPFGKSTLRRQSR